MIILRLLFKQEECLPKASNQSAPWHILEPWGCTMSGNCCPFVSWLRMALPVSVYLHFRSFQSSVIADTAAAHTNNKEEPTKFLLCLCFFFKIFCLFIFGCAGFLSLFGGFLRLWCWGFSLQWPCRTQALECTGFSICNARAQLPNGTCDLPGPGSEPISPALASRFLTTGPPGESCLFLSSKMYIVILFVPETKNISDVASQDFIHRDSFLAIILNDGF